MKKLLSLLLLVLLIPLISLAKEEDINKEGWLGLYSKSLSKPLRIALNVDNGVIVTSVTENSPAEKGGIEIGDIILKLDDKDIDSQKDLVKLVRSNPNKKVAVEIQRQGKKKIISLTIGEREEAESYEFKFKKPGKTWKKIKKYFQEIKPFWEKGTDKYREEMKRLKAELKDLQEQLKELKKELSGKLKEKGK